MSSLRKTLAATAIAACAAVGATPAANATVFVNDTTASAAPNTASLVVLQDLVEQQTNMNFVFLGAAGESVESADLTVLGVAHDEAHPNGAILFGTQAAEKNAAGVYNAITATGEAVTFQTIEADIESILGKGDGKGGSTMWILGKGDGKGGSTMWILGKGGDKGGSTMWILGKGDANNPSTH